VIWKALKFLDDYFEYIFMAVALILAVYATVLLNLFGILKL
jgi:hypothetical protein